MIKNQCGGKKGGCHFDEEPLLIYVKPSDPQGQRQFIYRTSSPRDKKDKSRGVVQYSVFSINSKNTDTI